MSLWCLDIIFQFKRCLKYTLKKICAALSFPFPPFTNCSHHLPNNSPALRLFPNPRSFQPLQNNKNKINTLTSLSHPVSLKSHVSLSTLSTARTPNCKNPNFSLHFRALSLSLSPELLTNLNLFEAQCHLCETQPLFNKVNRG